MGGIVSFTIAVLAVVAFAAAGSVVLAFVSAFIALICVWSWLHMWYFARLLARQRLFVAALLRGEFGHNSPEAERYWREIRIEVDPRDVADIPNWIAFLNMLASAAALVLCTWGAIAYWS